MSIRKPFHKSNSGYFEIARYACKIDSIVVGGVGKLINQAKIYAIEHHVSKLLTYVDERMGGEGQAYQLVGFHLRNVSPPRFWWTNGNIRYNRFHFRANSKKNLSEKDVADEAGVVKIWACRNLVFELSSI
jgi:hypothetical protein